jgi:hypothetical protein
MRKSAIADLPARPEGLSALRTLHGGTVTIDPTLGKGTTVTCVFPVEQAKKQTAASFRCA